MIFNDRLLFLHVPKTAGMAMTQALLQGLPGPVFCTAPAGHHPDRVAQEQVLPGTRHETLAGARRVLATQGRDLAGFERIVAVVRNPYAQEASRFHYLRKGHGFDRGPAQDLALAGDFEAFAVHSAWWFDDIAAYYTLDGVAPPNLRLLRHERLADDFKEFVQPFLRADTALPYLNASGDSGASACLTPAAEAAIHAKYRWLFDAGLYPRRQGSD